MTLSVIIVSYNVKYFLEQCLCSVQRAMQSEQADMEVEVFVVDNQSPDGSVEYIRSRYPFVRMIVNRENVGFGAANNQALAAATGKYVLFLNPDTIISEDFFSSCTGFMETHAGAGALGVRMIDGRGRFLKESKRGFPTPWVAFCKMTGLIRLFPRSKLFAGYYLGHLSEHEAHAVDALAGACMLVRKDVLTKTGGFDERFFMYAEDIDLSYRIQQAGYTNYYFPQCTIIHFKGESTRKDARYAKLFYKAMIQFVQKHFRKSRSRFGVALLEGAIRLRLGLAMLWVKKKTGNSPGSTPSRSDQQFSFVRDAEMVHKLAGNAHTGSAAATLPVVFCEGADLPFKAIIEAMQQLPGNQMKFVHGNGTGSMVGSNSPDGQGEAFPMEAGNNKC